MEVRNSHLERSDLFRIVLVFKVFFVALVAICPVLDDRIEVSILERQTAEAFGFARLLVLAAPPLELLSEGARDLEALARIDSADIVVEARHVANEPCRANGESTPFPFGERGDCDTEGRLAVSVVDGGRFSRSCSTPQRIEVETQRVRLGLNSDGRAFDAFDGRGDRIPETARGRGRVRTTARFPPVSATEQLPAGPLHAAETVVLGQGLAADELVWRLEADLDRRRDAVEEGGEGVPRDRALQVTHGGGVMRNVAEERTQDCDVRVRNLARADAEKGHLEHSRQDGKDEALSELERQRIIFGLGCPRRLQLFDHIVGVESHLGSVVFEVVRDRRRSDRAVAIAPLDHQRLWRRARPVRRLDTVRLVPAVMLRGVPFRRRRRHWRSSRRFCLVAGFGRHEFAQDSVFGAVLQERGNVDDSEHAPLAVAKDGSVLEVSCCRRGVASRLVERPRFLTQAFEEPLEALVEVVQRNLGEEHAVQVDEEFLLGDVGLRAACLMLLLEERQDRFASRQVRVCRGET